MVLDNLMNESYEYLLEFQQEMHELDMKMIKCEHHCIVNEDSNMMMLAEEEYKNNVTAALKAIWNKIVVMVQNCIIAINKAINKFRMRFKVSNTLKQTAKEAARMINDPSTYTTYGKVSSKDEKEKGLGGVVKLKKEIYMSMSILKDPKGFTNKINSTIDELKKLKNDNFDNKKAKEILDNMTEYYSDKLDGANIHETRSLVNAEHVVSAYTIISEYGPQWIKSLEIARNEAKTRLSDIAKDAKSTADATYFQRIINSCIFAIQKIITNCFKICYTVEAVTTKTDTGRRDADEAERVEEIGKKHKKEVDIITAQRDLAERRRIQNGNRVHELSSELEKERKNK